MTIRGQKWGRRFAILTCAAAAVLCWRIAKRSVPQVPFDSTEWIGAGHSPGRDSTAPTRRQQMVRDLVVRHLAGKSQAEIVAMLGPSPSHEDMACMTDGDIREMLSGGVRRKSGAGYYFDDYEWDLIYEIGRERIFLFDHRGVAGSPDPERLVIRLDGKGQFESWYVIGSPRWAQIVGPEGMGTYRQVRDRH